MHGLRDKMQKKRANFVKQTRKKTDIETARFEWQSWNLEPFRREEDVHTINGIGL